MAELPTPQEIRDRYKNTVTKVDTLGRAIKVCQLRMSEETRAAEYAESFASVEMMRTVAAIRGIDDDSIRFPKSRAEIDALMDRLDREGLMAARQGMTELTGPAKTLDEQADAAKN